MSNEGDPIVAARKCGEQRIPISTILIDPTPVGKEIAWAISIGGEVIAVTSSDNLHFTLEAEKDAYVGAAKRAVQTEWLQLSALITSILGLSIGVTTLSSKILDNPSVAINSIIVVVGIIGSILFIYRFIAKEETQITMYKTWNDSYNPIYYRYNKRARILSLLVGIVCILMSLTFMTSIYFQIGNTFINKIQPMKPSISSVAEVDEKKKESLFIPDWL